MSNNPFIPPPPPLPQPTIVEPDPVWDGALALEGPPTVATAPTPDVTGEALWPRVEVAERPVVCVMGTHGGAGASTVAALLGDEALDVGTCWPKAVGWERPLPVLNVVAVARTHHAGIEAGKRFARQWAAGNLSEANLLGIVVIDDGPKISRSQKLAAQGLGRLTPHGWHIPWNEAWRLAPAELDAAGGRVKKIVKHIKTLARKGT